jgi:tetratricopeptide (TPR) repeat protein
VTARARLALALMALLALVIFAYAPVKHGVLLLEDHSLVQTNPLVSKGTVRQIFSQPFGTNHPLSEARPVYYRPLTVLSLRADFGMGGQLPQPPYHGTNLLLHLGAVVALVMTARRLGASATASMMAALVWSLAPRSTEAVAWISGRADLLAALFGIAAVGAWPWYGDEKKGARARAALAAVALLLALLSKEVGIAAAAAMAVGTVLATPGKARERIGRAAPKLAVLGIPLAVYAVMRAMATRGATSVLVPLGAEARARVALETLGRYVEMTLDPWHPATSIGLLGELDVARAILGAVVLAGSSALVARAFLRRRRGGGDAGDAGDAGAAGAAGDAVHAADAAPPPSAGLAPRAVGTGAAAALGLASLALVVHVVPIAVVAAVAADHLLYLPLAGLALALAVASSALSPRGQKIAGGAALALGMTFVPVTRARALEYTDDIAFRVAAAEHAHPHNPAAKAGLANALRADAELDIACRLHASAARTLQQRGAAAIPRYVRALESTGNCYEMLSAYDRAAAVYALLLRLRPNSGRLHMEIGFLYLHTLDFEEAEASLQRALALDPSLEAARKALAALPGTRAAIARFATEDAKQADAIGWARLLTALGRVSDATKVWSEIVLDPTSPDWQASNGIDFVMANADIETARRAGEAYYARNTADISVARRLLTKRLAHQKTIDALRPRLEALAAQ